jgi:hypothetical protein
LTRNLPIARRYPSGNAVHPAASQHAVFNAQQPALRPPESWASSGPPMNSPRALSARRRLISATDKHRRNTLGAWRGQNFYSVC